MILEINFIYLNHGQYSGGIYMKFGMAMAANDSCPTLNFGPCSSHTFGVVRV